MVEATRNSANEAATVVKLPWEPMELTAVGTVAALLEAAVGSRNDGGGGMGAPNMMVGA